MRQEQRPERSFDEKKTVYFSRLASSVLSAMRSHKNPGLLWERNKEGKRDWGNVSEHCLVELARVQILVKKLGISKEASRNLEIAAALHDFDKRHEILAMKAALKQRKSSLEVSNEADAWGERELREAGFSEEVIELANCVGGKPQQLFAIAEKLEKEEPTDHEIALLVLHYADGYTRGNDWAEPVQLISEGLKINEVDRRVQKNLENPTYRESDRAYMPAFAGHPLLRGRGPIENEGVICHEIEKRLVGLITSRTGEKIDPLELPSVIDGEIKKKIEETKS